MENKETEEILQEEILQEENDTLELELDEMKNSFQRLQADFANYKKRVEREKKQIISFANEKIITELLPVLDNLERALVSCEQEESGIKEGVNMVFDQFIQVLENNGLKIIEDLDCEFDPNFHHAVLQEEVDGVNSGTIIEVFQKGYKLNEKVIRPSMVKVAQ